MSCVYGGGGLLTVADSITNNLNTPDAYSNFTSVVSSSSYMDISENTGTAAPMQPMDQQKLNQTMMWQQNQYMADSGIQSSVTTRVSVGFSLGNCSEISWFL